MVTQQCRCQDSVHPYSYALDPGPYAQSANPERYVRSTNQPTYVCTHTYMCTCRMCICIYIYMYVYTYIYIHTHAPHAYCEKQCYRRSVERTQQLTTKRSVHERGHYGQAGLLGFQVKACSSTLRSYCMGLIIIRIGSWGRLYYHRNKEPPN